MRKALYFLGILNDSDIDWLMAAGHRREVPAGTAIIHEGRPLDSVYLVIDGAFSVRVQALANREIARLMSGEVMGEMSFVDQARPPPLCRRSKRPAYSKFHAAASTPNSPKTQASPHAFIARFPCSWHPGFAPQTRRRPAVPPMTMKLRTAR